MVRSCLSSLHCLFALCSAADAVRRSARRQYFPCSVSRRRLESARLFPKRVHRINPYSRRAQAHFPYFPKPPLNPAFQTRPLLRAVFDRHTAEDIRSEEGRKIYASFLRSVKTAAAPTAATNAPTTCICAPVLGISTSCVFLSDAVVGSIGSDLSVGTGSVGSSAGSA